VIRFFYVIKTIFSKQNHIYNKKNANFKKNPKICSKNINNIKLVNNKNDKIDLKKIKAIRILN